MKFAVSIAALAVAAVPSVAFAQSGAPFSGPYVGAIAGYDHVKISDSTASDSKDGFAYGANVGYDANLGDLVVGVEAEVAGSTVKDTVTDGVNTYTVKAGRDLYVGARAGFLATPQTLLYVKAGYANGRIKLDNNGANLASDNVDGVRVGAGVEQSFGPFAARLEYRYTDYSNIKYLGVDTGLDAKRHQVVAGLIARF